MNTQPAERNQDATVYVGGLDEKCSEELLWELFLQAGPVVNVHMPRDRVTGYHQNYGFVEYLGEEDAEYAQKIMNMINLYGKPLRVSKASSHGKNMDVGANLYVGNLGPEVDEKLVYDTFSAFGVILQHPKIMRDPETGASKGFAFVNFASFESSDAAIKAMNGQYLSNRPLKVTYARKKDSTEEHGSNAERMLAASSSSALKSSMPHQTFADKSGSGPNLASPRAPEQPIRPAAAPHMHLPAGMHLGQAPPMQGGFRPQQRLPPPPPQQMFGQPQRLPPPPQHMFGGPRGQRLPPPPPLNMAPRPRGGFMRPHRPFNPHGPPPPHHRQHSHARPPFQHHHHHRPQQPPPSPSPSQSQQQGEEALPNQRQVPNGTSDSSTAAPSAANDLSGEEAYLRRMQMS